MIQLMDYMNQFANQIMKVLSYFSWCEMIIIISIIVSGKKKVCVDTHYEYVYELLEKRLWDEPNKVIWNIMYRNILQMHDIDQMLCYC